MPSAADLALGLKLRRSGRIWTGECPACGYKGAFTVREQYGTTLVHCHAGCAQEDVLAQLRNAGLWSRPTDSTLQLPTAKLRCGPMASAAVASEAALALWRASIAAEGTPAARYLESRGLNEAIPPCLHFLPGCRHSPTGTRHPTMIAGVQNAGGEVVAIHRTYLRADGSGKAQVEPAKMTLGPVRGGAVRLAQCTERLVVAEGIETALSIQQASGIPAWAALSAGGIRSLVLPPLPLAATVTIAADPDRVGMAAAYSAAERWHAQGRQVRIATPPVGSDFNDLLRRGA